MYCGACAHDAALARALIAQGHDMQVVPLYTPLRLDQNLAAATAPVFLGAINAYLQQLSPVFARFPAFLTHALDHPSLLNWVSKFAVRTKPAQLGPMTVSVLAGTEGRQRGELRKLMDFLRAQPPPDLISITNSLLSALAPEVKRDFGAPVVCGLQGEEGFVAGLPELFRAQAHELMRDHARHVDLFVAPGEAYAAEMADFLQVPASKVRVLRPCLEVADFARPGARPRDPFVLGYLSVITPRKGLHVLVDAFRKLAVEQKRNLVLRVAGRILNRGYWKQISRTIASAGLSDRFEYLGEVDRRGKIALLHGCSAFSQPALEPEARGMAAMEAMAAGVPVVVPDSGVFPEMLSLAPGGLLFPPRDADGLAAAVAHLMDDPAGADRLGRAGAEGIAEHFSAVRMGQEAAALFEQLAAR